MASSSEPLLTPVVAPTRRGMQSIGASGLSRWLVPSFADLQFLSVILWLFAVGTAGWAQLLMDCDAGWHIRTGEWILANRAVPQVDMFSFSRPGEPWFAWEWGAEVIYGGLHLLGGLRAVVLFAAVLVAVFGALVFRRAVWHGANLFIALPLVLLCVGATTVHILARPHLWTLVLFALSLFLLETDRRTPSRRVWWLVPLTVWWVNVHGGWAALIATLGIYAAGSAVETWLEKGNWRVPLRYLALMGACLAATLVNPFTWRLHVHVFHYLQASWIKNLVAEFQSPSFRSENMLQFEILLMAGLIASGYYLMRRRFVEPLLMLFWAHSSLVSARHLPLYCAVAAPLVAGLLAEFWRKWTAGQKKSSFAGIMDGLAADTLPSMKRMSVWAALPIVWLAVTSQPLHWPSDFPKEVFPVETVAKHRASIEGRRVFTEDQWGDYLIYKLWPKQRVFFDGRSDFYGYDLGKEYLAVMRAEHNWEQVLNKYHIDVVLAPASWGLCSVLKLAPGWRVVDDNGKVLLFERRPRGKSRMAGLMDSPRTDEGSGGD